MAKAVSTEPVKRVRKTYEEKLAELQAKHEEQIEKAKAKAVADLEKLELDVLKAEGKLADAIVKRDEARVRAGIEPEFDDEIDQLEIVNADV